LLIVVLRWWRDGRGRRRIGRVRLAGEGRRRGGRGGVMVAW